MYIVAIGWLYVAFMMSLGERSIVGGVITFALYGVAPTALILWLAGSSARRRRRKKLQDSVVHEAVSDSDDGHTRENERRL